MGINCLLVFQKSFSFFYPFLKPLQISLKFGCTPALSRKKFQENVDWVMRAVFFFAIPCHRNLSLASLLLPVTVSRRQGEQIPAGDCYRMLLQTGIVAKFEKSFASQPLCFKYPSLPGTGVLTLPRNGHEVLIGWFKMDSMFRIPLVADFATDHSLKPTRRTWALLFSAEIWRMKPKIWQWHGKICS